MCLKMCMLISFTQFEKSENFFFQDITMYNLYISGYGVGSKVICLSTLGKHQQAFIKYENFFSL